MGGRLLCLETGGWGCMQRKSETSISWFHADTGFYFLENYLFSGRFFGPEKGLDEQILSDSMPPITPEPS